MDGKGIAPVLNKNMRTLSVLQDADDLKWVVVAKEVKS